ncbi:MAG: response regulator [Calditrichaeota bacterium]|nr:response regulator [Calditrichota bacterium]
MEVELKQSGWAGRLSSIFIIGLLITIGSAAHIHSPNYPFKIYSVDDGLPQSIVSGIIQDTYGFIWLSTNEGIARFNGTAFRVYNEETGYPFRLVTGLVENQPGDIWVATLVNGLWRVRNSHAEPIVFTTEFSNQRLNYLTRTHDGEILLAAEPGGLYVFRNDTVVRHLYDRNGRNDDLQGPIISAAKDYAGRYWVGTYQNGVQVFQQDDEIFTLTTENGLPSNEIRSILALPNGEVWIGTARGLYIWNNPRLTEKFYQHFGNVFVSHLYSRDGRSVWINLASSPGGVVHVREGQFVEIIQPLPGMFSKCNFIDQSGAFFIGTYRGLVVIPNRNFQNFGAQDGFRTSYIRAIHRDGQGNILVATRNDGLYRLEDGLFVRLDQFENVFGENSIFTLANVGDALWIGTSRGLFIIKNNRLLENDYTALFQQRTVRRIIPDGGKWYILTQREVYVYDGDQLRDITHNLRGQFISFWGIARDRQGQLWLGTNGRGLYRLVDTTWVPYETHYPVHKIFALRKDPDGNIYIATSRGLFKWDGEQLSQELMLKHTIWDVLPTRRNGIWLLTSKGLFQFTEERIRIFNKRQGLITTEFNMGAILYEDEDNLWFGGVEGLVHYQKKMEYTDYLPWFYITKIVAEDTTLSFPFPDEIVLQAGQNNLKIYFTRINYGTFSDLRYAYHLNGFHRDTLAADDLSFINYTNLSDGPYTFSLLLINPVNGHTLATKTVHFTILKPWWKSAWFLLLAISFLSGVVYLSIRWREAYHRKRTLQLEKQVEERTRAIELSYQLLKKETEERKRVQASLRKEREELAVTLKSIADGVIRTDREGRVLLLNSAAEKLIGISSEKATGKKLNEILELESENSHERIFIPQYIHHLEKQGKNTSYFTARLKNTHHPNEKVVSISWAQVTDEAASESGYVWVIRDISTERQLENEMIKAQKLESIGLLAGGIAHDFNNILSGILGNAQLARMMYASGVNIEKYLKGIEEATKNASHLTQQLLTFAKGGEPVKEEISLKDMLKDSVEFALRGSSVACNMVIDDNLWVVQADPGQLNQVINNLVINAVQAMPGGGNLTIKAENCHREQMQERAHEVSDLEGLYFVRLTFSDTGIGIPRENLTKIFDPYFTTKQKGSGLGLATTYAIIQKHGGKILVESELGKGTTFIIYLPAIPETGRRHQETHSFQLSTNGNYRALVMDDEEYILDLFKNFLGMMNIEVETAREGAEAVRKYREAMEANRPFDVVIMDLTIRGGMGGKEAVQQILEIDPQARVIVASGYSTDSVLANYEKFGFVGRIHKPFTMESINRVLHSVLSEG